MPPSRTVPPDTPYPDNRAARNLEALRGLIDAFNAHDLDRVMRFFAEDCSLDMPRGNAPWGARYVGKGTLSSGRKIAVRGCDHYEFRDGKVIRKDSYWKIVE